MGRARAAAGHGPRPPPAARVAAGPDPAEAIAAILERVGRSDRDELDRLALAEPAPIAFLATIRRFVSPERRRRPRPAAKAVRAAVPAGGAASAGIRDAVVGHVAELILGETLEELLGGAGGERARERLTRGWDAAVGQPRYGPATPAVHGLLVRLRAAHARRGAALAATGDRDRLGEAPWPPATSRDEDEALRVSSELAAIDAAAAVGSAGWGSAALDRARRRPRRSRTCSSCATRSPCARSSCTPPRGGHVHRRRAPAREQGCARSHRPVCDARGVDPLARHARSHGPCLAVIRRGAPCRRSGAALRDERAAGGAAGDATDRGRPGTSRARSAEAATSSPTSWSGGPVCSSSARTCASAAPTRPPTSCSVAARATWSGGRSWRRSSTRRSRRSRRCDRGLGRRSGEVRIAGADGPTIAVRARRDGGGWRPG